VQPLLNAPESSRDSSMFSVSPQSGHAAVMFSSADDELARLVVAVERDCPIAKWRYTSLPPSPACIRRSG
jgi:hypothetical protein